MVSDLGSALSMRVTETEEEEDDRPDPGEIDDGRDKAPDSCTYIQV